MSSKQFLWLVVTIISISLIMLYSIISISKPHAISSDSVQKSNQIVAHNYAGSDKDILYQKQEIWGPCGIGETCSNKVTLYNSGKLTFSNALDENISAETLTQVGSRIEQTNILNKECPTPIVLDYSAKYLIQYSGRSRELQFPGCEDDLNYIEELFID